METNERTLQELPSPSERDNSIDEELNELELDALAGGYHIYTATNGADWQEQKSKVDWNKAFFNRFNPNAW
ncbi:hypothetical protein QUA30_05320 [Microcoleus sp. Pol14C2]|uniref:hypothetical protein n=1 Tax=unclassified Microcoleus TaxID=2642155 RepID=UPI002FD10DDE